MRSCEPATEPHQAYTDALLAEQSFEHLTNMVVKMFLAWLAFFSAGPLILLCVFAVHSLKRRLGRGGDADPAVVQQLEEAIAAADEDRVG